MRCDCSRYPVGRNLLVASGTLITIYQLNVITVYRDRTVGIETNQFDG